MSFDPTSFLQQTMTDTAFATSRTPIPEGEYTAVIDDVKARSTNNGQILVDVSWNVIDEALRTKMGRTGDQKLFARQSVFLDLDANGKLLGGEDKNVDLGKIRKAVGQNIAGQAWGPLMLKGAGPATIRIKQKPNEDNPEEPFVNVTAVRALS